MQIKVRAGARTSRCSQLPRTSRSQGFNPYPAPAARYGLPGTAAPGSGRHSTRAAPPRPPRPGPAALRGAGARGRRGAELSSEGPVGAGRAGPAASPRWAGGGWGWHGRAARGKTQRGRPRNAPTPPPCLQTRSDSARFLLTWAVCSRARRRAGEHRAPYSALQPRASPPARRCGAGAAPRSRDGRPGGGGGASGPGHSSPHPPPPPRARPFVPRQLRGTGLFSAGRAGAAPSRGARAAMAAAGRSVRGGAGAGAGRGERGPPLRAAAAAFIWRRRGAPRSSRRSLAAVQPLAASARHPPSRPPRREGAGTVSAPKHAAPSRLVVAFPNPPRRAGSFGPSCISDHYRI